MRARPIAIGLSAIALAFVFGLSRGHVVDGSAHDRYSHALRQLSALDAQLNDEVLQADKGMVRHYDPVVRTLGVLHKMPGELRRPPKFLAPDGRAEVLADLDGFSAALQQKEELIEQFKSEAAVLKNSLHYFPIAAEAFEKAAGDRAVATERLLRHLLLYNQRPDEELERAVAGDLAEIGERANGRATDEDLRLLRTHATVILERRPRVDRVLKQIGTLDTGARADAIFAAYDRAYQKAVERTYVWRGVMAALGLLLVGLASLEVSGRFRKNAAALKRERENVEKLLLNAPGVVIGERFHLERRLGEGGMGVVWAARNAKTSQPVALKFVKNMGEARQDVRRRFLREARAASLLGHPNVVRIHEILELEDGSPVLVMDLLSGCSLGEHLKRSGAIPLAELGAILRPVVAAVAAAHSRGIIHRDLKPDNVFLVENDGRREVKVLDFGAAKMTAADGDAAHSGALTRTGDMIGTPYYMSPEQAFGESDIDARADVWSLGVIVFECLAGRRPFEGDNPGQLYKRILSDEAPVLDGVPDEVRELVRTMLAKDRAHRLADLARVDEVLARYAGREERRAHV